MRPQKQQQECGRFRAMAKTRRHKLKALKGCASILWNKVKLQCFACSTHCALPTMNMRVRLTCMPRCYIAMHCRFWQLYTHATPPAVPLYRFREFSDEFLDVGLMTGDVTINPTASCLVSTKIVQPQYYYSRCHWVAWVCMGVHAQPYLVTCLRSFGSR